MNHAGEIPLPIRSVFIGIPSSAKVLVNYQIIKQNSYATIPGFNPEVKAINDSILSYNYFPSKLNKSEIGPDIKIKGYLWIDGIYTVHLEINQYYYDNINVKLNEIELVHVELTINKNIIAEGKRLKGKPIILSNQFF